MKQLPNQIVFDEISRLVAIGQSVTIVLRGNSMSPLLRDARHHVCLSPVTKPLAVGDIVLFRHHGQYILHRLVAKSPTTLTFQGDNNIAREVVAPTDVAAILTSVTTPQGRTIDCDSTEWKLLSALSVARRKLRVIAHRCLNKEMRKKLRPWYFLTLAILMWAPLNGLAAQMPNYVLGLRMDHLVHASIYLLCAPFLMDVTHNPAQGRLAQTVKLILLSSAIGIFTESVQYLLPYRGFDVNDILANIIGATLGTASLIPHLARKNG